MNSCVNTCVSLRRVLLTVVELALAEILDVLPLAPTQTLCRLVIIHNPAETLHLQYAM